MARRLTALCAGTFGANADADRLSWTLAFPAKEQRVVLVIDDNADALQLFQRYASGTRYRVIGTRDAEAAPALAARLSPAAVVLDVMMPQMDGWEVLARLRQHPATASLPIIVCTILPQEELALSLGASGFIRKPVTQQMFLGALEHLLLSAETKPR